jgi:hypothetical protein
MNDVSTAERYISATRSSNLAVSTQRVSDADTLLAAGYAAQKNHKAMLALEFYRLQTGDMGGFNRLTGVAGQWLHNRSRRKGRKRLNALQAREIASRALIWWMKPTCKACNGIGHPLITGTPVINFAHDCEVCHGTGKHPIQRVVPIGSSDEARWLIDQLDAMVFNVFGDMAKLLSKRIAEMG